MNRYNNNLLLSILFFIYYWLPINIVNAQQLKLILPIGHTNMINTVNFSPDTKKIVTASQDHTAKIWDVISGTLLADIKGYNNPVISAHFSPDGKRVLTAGDSTAKIWDAATRDAFC